MTTADLAEQIDGAHLAHALALAALRNPDSDDVPVALSAWLNDNGQDPSPTTRVAAHALMHLTGWLLALAGDRTEAVARAIELEALALADDHQP